MPEPDRNSISTRLWRLPGQLFLALINATAILVIVAAILALVAFARLQHLAGNVASTMTEAVLARVDLKPGQALANLQSLTNEVRALADALRKAEARADPILQSRIATLKETLNGLRVSVDRLGEARLMLTDEAIARVGSAVTDALQKLGNCPSAAPNAPA
jgi:hypothetical protein